MIQDNKETISLVDFFEGFKSLIYLFLRFWKLLFFITILGSCVGFLFSSSSDSIYRSEIKFIVHEQRPKTLTNSFANNLGFDLNLVEDLNIFERNTLIDVLKSRDVIQKSLLKSVKYKNKQIKFIDLFRKLYHKEFDLAQLNKQSSLRKKNIILSIAYNIIVNEFLTIDYYKPNRNILIAELKTKNEFFSINFLSKIFEIVLDDYKHMKIKNIKVLENRIKTLKNETNELIKINGNYQSLKSDPLNFNYQGHNLDIDLNMRILKELSEQFEIAKINILNSSRLIQVIDQKPSPLEDEKSSSIYSIVIFGFFSLASTFLTIIVMQRIRKYLY